MPTKFALKSALKLDKFKYVWIQKIIGIAQPIYLITIDSRYPNVYLSFKSVKNSKTAVLTTLERSGLTFLNKKVKMTPPIQLEQSHFALSSRDIIILRDIAGDYFSNPKMFENQQFPKGLKIFEAINE
jgi:hypothetical protein